MTDEHTEIEALKRRVAELENGESKRRVPAGPGAKAEQEAGRALWVAGAIGAVVVIGLIIWSSASRSNPCADPSGAAEYAKRSALLLLRYPQTAKFDVQTDDLGSCQFRVHGTASALNGFGNAVPKDVDITVKGGDAPGRFSLVSSNLVSELTHDLE